MRKLPIVLLLLLVISFVACNKEESTWEKYQAWRDNNISFFDEKTKETDAEGLNVYTKVIPDWNTGIFILMQQFKKGTGTQSPYLTSTVAAKYKGTFYNGTAFDSSYAAIDSLSTFKINGVVEGWQIALQYMVEGDSCKLIIPYNLGYGANGRTDSYGNYTILPYSTLIFDLKLVEIMALNKP